MSIRWTVDEVVIGCVDQTSLIAKVIGVPATACTGSLAFVHKDLQSKLDGSFKVDEYIGHDFDSIADLQRKLSMVIRRVIHHDPATIVYWLDGTKTVVKVQDGDTYDPEKGLAMAICKKALGNEGNYNDVFKKWLPKED